MAASRCPVCLTNWPNITKYSECPLCEDEKGKPVRTTWAGVEDGLSASEASHKVFEVLYERRGPRAAQVNPIYDDMIAAARALASLPTTATGTL